MNNVHCCVFLLFLCVIIDNVESQTSTSNQTTSSKVVMTNNDKDTICDTDPSQTSTTSTEDKKNDTRRRSRRRSRSWKKKNTLNNQSYLPIFFLTTILTVILYSVIFMALLKTRRKPTSVFIVSLGIADLFVAVVIIPLKISETYGSTWQKNPYNCRVVSCLTLLSIAMASVNMVFISLNRLVFFLKPIKYKQIIDFRKAIIGCCISYTLTIPTLLPIVGVMMKSSSSPLKFCAFKFTLSNAYLWIIGIFYFLIPSLIIVISQIIIFSLAARFYYAQHAATNTSSTTTTPTITTTTPTTSTTGSRALTTKDYLLLTSKKSQRVQRMFLFIILMYFICWGPFVAGIVCNLVAQHLITPIFIQVMRILVFTNSFINPLIILVTNPEYTRTLFTYANRVTPTAVEHQELDDATIRSSSFHRINRNAILSISNQATT